MIATWLEKHHPGRARKCLGRVVTLNLNNSRRVMQRDKMTRYIDYQFHKIT